MKILIKRIIAVAGCAVIILLVGILVYQYRSSVTIGDKVGITEMLEQYCDSSIEILDIESPKENTDKFFAVLHREGEYIGISVFEQSAVFPKRFHVMGGVYQIPEGEKEIYLTTQEGWEIFAAGGFHLKEKNYSFDSYGKKVQGNISDGMFLVITAEKS